MKTGIKVYIAGPFSSAPTANTHRAIQVANELVAAGFVPFVPHLSLAWDLVEPRPYEFWIAYDLHWLRACDAVLRMPGESAGAEREIVEAARLGLPVSLTIDGLRSVFAERIRRMTEVSL